MYLLRNKIQDYSWGSTTAIPQLFGLAVTGGPQAEMWLGAHPGAPSFLVDEGEGLDAFIVGHPSVLGDAGKTLPFLLKVLAAAQPLSLQVHPTRAQAAAGFAAETAAGIALDDPKRNYKDANHKPEMILALSDFAALCGFREPAEISKDFAALLPNLTAFGAELLAALARPQALKEAFSLLLGGGGQVRELVAQLRAGAAAKPQLPGADTVSFISSFYGDDPGVAAALLLNRINLAPGEAIYLGAGNIHAYLHGLGIEIMAASDNVLRGGLTQKHIDIAELSRIVNFVPTVPNLVSATTSLVNGNRVSTLQPGIADFALTDIELAAGSGAVELPAGPAVALQLRGSATLGVVSADVLCPSAKDELHIARGQSVFVPAGCKIAAQAGAGSGRLVVARPGG
jgi:mannose-6-phosphate isomerase